MKKFIKIFLVTLMVLMATGCTSVKPYVAYSVYPVGYLIDRISGGKVEAYSIQNDSIVQTSSLVDNYQEILEDSTYFFHIGDLEPYLDIYSKEFVETGVEEVDLSTLNAIYKFQRYTLVYVDGKESYIESPYYNSDLFDELDQNENDLMLWMDPIGMLSMAKDVYKVLASNYVEGAATFKENFDKLQADLISLDASYQNLATRLKKENRTIKFVSMSASFGNWQKAYGFQIYPVCLSKYGALPSKVELEVIKERIIADDVHYIAYEPNMTEEMLQLFNELEDELNLTRVNLNNISSLTASQIANNKDYLSLMYENLSVLENITTELMNDDNTSDQTIEGEVVIPEENLDVE